MPDMLKTPAEMAQIMQDAILAIASEKVASYTVEGQTFTMHNLSKLQELESHYRKQANAARWGSVATVDMRGAFGTGTIS